jgi:hypothetical protein
MLYLVSSDGKVWTWDTGTASNVVGFIATNFAGVGVTRKRDAIRMVETLGGINGSVRIFRDLTYDTMLANGVGGSATFTLANPTNTSRHYPAWKLRYPGKSFALRWDFNQPAGSLLLESFEVLTLQREEAQS